MSFGTNGKAHIASQLSSSPTAEMISIAVGTGTPSGTGLGAEVGRRNVWERSQSGEVTTYKVHFDIDDNFAGTITEAGIFNSETPSSGTMLCSGAISPSIVKALNDSLDITWTVTI